MNLRKVISLFAIIVIAMFFCIPNMVKAASGTRYFGIIELRKNDTPNFGYAIGNPSANGTSGNAAKIWNIIEYQTSDGEGIKNTENIYCVKAGVGFGDTRKRATYDVSYDMKTERNKIKERNNATLTSIVDGTVPYGATTVSKYDALLALGDMLYLINSSDNKADFLEMTGANQVDGASIYPLTRDDIAAVQQAAIWYFTNYGEENGKYDKTNTTADLWLNYTTDGSTYTTLSDYKRSDTDEGYIRAQQAEVLYKYLINTAKANANNYSDSSKLGAPAKVVTTSLSYTESGSNFVIGPIRIDKVEGNNANYIIDFNVNKKYTLLDSNKKTTSKTIKELVGTDFYISVAKSEADTITVSTDIKYSNTKLTLWASQTNNLEQPLLIPERTTESVPLSLSVTPKEKKFDLALRKYITKINGADVENSRTPVIDSSKLNQNGETTATYKHRKDPVSIKTNDVVTYKMTIYNEGEADGRATKVVDQLPAGLHFESVISGNFEKENYNETSNTLTLTRKTNNTTNLAAYTSGNPKSETIEIKCKVTAIAGSTDNILTNVAWISEEINAVSGEKITTATKKDRDSEPGTIPSVNKDNMSNYKGNSNNKNTLTDSEYYYKGEQDDDDFEKLVMPKAEGSYNVQIVKVDSKNEKTKLSGAKFSVKMPDNTIKTGTTNGSGVYSVGTVNITETGTDTLTIEETEAPANYKKIIGSVTVKVTKTLSNGAYVASNATLTGSDDAKVTISGSTIIVTVKDEEKAYDLSLRKSITKLNGQDKSSTRLPQVETGNLNKNGNTTAKYNHDKEALKADINQEIEYTITVYNEGEIAGYAGEIKDYLPAGIEYVGLVNTSDSTKYEVKANKESTTGKTTLTITNKEKKVLQPYSTTLDKAEFKIKCKITATRTKGGQVLTNIAEITDYRDENGNDMKEKDRDSNPTNFPDNKKNNDYNGNGKDGNYVPGQQDDDDFEKVVMPKAEGSYNVQIVKVDSKNETTKLSGAKFSVKMPDNTIKTGTTNGSGVYSVGTVNITETGTDTLTIEETEAPANYKKIIGSVTVKVTKTLSNGAYVASNATLTGSDDAKVTISGSTIIVTVKDEEKAYDLSLRKSITKLNGQDKSSTRLPQVETGNLNKNGNTTAKYNHDKEALKADINQEIEYTITVYNEGEIAGYAGEIKDYLPAGIEYVGLVNTSDSTKYEVKANKESTTGKTTLTITNKEKKVLQPYSTTLDKAEFKIKCKITATRTKGGQVLTNIAEITDYRDENGNDMKEKDRDSNPTNFPDNKKNNDYNGNGKDGNYVPGQQDDDDFEKVVIPKAEGSYNLKLVKVDKDNTAKTLEGAEFKITLADGTVKTETTNGNGCISIDGIEIVEAGTDVITIEETKAPYGYKKLINSTKLDIIKVLENGEYKVNNIDLKDTNWIQNEPNGEVVKAELDNGVITLTIQNKPKIFDLALRKFIVAVSKDETIESNEYLKNSDGSYTREPKVDTSKLNTKDSDGKTITTAIYNHSKTPIEVSRENIVVYNLRVYNEGNIDGYAGEIIDYLPSNLEFVTGEFNNKYGWTEVEGANGRKYKTDYLKNAKIDAAKEGTDGKIILEYKEVPIMCKIKDTSASGECITNIADITKYIDEDGTTILDKDRDSEPKNVDYKEGNKPNYKNDETGNYVPGQQDDDDFEKVIIPKKVDLALTKFITAISVDEKIENREYLTADKTEKDAGSKINPYTRQTAVDTKELRDNIKCHDATYKQVKTPLVIGRNYYVLYNIRVYNEGEVDVFAGEVSDYLPENLSFVDGDFNKKYGWTAEGQLVKTTYLSSKNGEDKILKAFDKEKDDGEGSGLDYKDLPILCQVNSKAQSGKELINTAEITKYEDQDGKEIPKDEDSTPKNKQTKNDKTREEDDDDFEVIIVRNIDLALTKFITAISSDEKIEDGEYLTVDATGKKAGSKTNPYTRQTAVDTKELRDKSDCNDATYKQVKTPLVIGKNSYILYNIRVYNEGEMDVYAGEVTDYLPENLSFVDGEFNKKYGWTAEGQTVKTTYISSKNGEDKILKAFDKEKDDGEGSGLDYKDLPILCQINSNTPANKELVNTAEITKYEDKDGIPIPKDIDSEPENKKNKNDKNREQDDDDYEVVVVKEFDLALRKWVTQAIVIENGKQAVTNTGHKPYDDPEQVVKVDLDRKKLSQVTVKFKYSIRVINEGDLEGYAKEITDYVPQGLKFVEADNKNWKNEGNNVISTRQLENVLLKPGEYKDIEVILTWENNPNNMGLKTNIAEISEDYNKYGVPDKDSTPDNKKTGEDDIDDAPVMLSIKTGQVRIYFTLGFIVLITIAGGIFGIKKYVI